MTGFAASVGNVASTDTILQAFGKLEQKVNSANGALLTPGGVKYSHLAPANGELESCANYQVLVWPTATGWTCSGSSTEDTNNR